MTTPMITWISVAAFIAALVIIRTVLSAFHSHQHRHAHSRARHLHHHLIEIGSEREEFFLPGDPDINDDDYDE